MQGRQRDVSPYGPVRASPTKENGGHHEDAAVRTDRPPEGAAPDPGQGRDHGDDEFEPRARAARLLAEASVALGRCASADSALHLAADAARSLTGAQYAFGTLAANPGEPQRVVSASGCELPCEGVVQGWPLGELGDRVGSAARPLRISGLPSNAAAELTAGADGAWPAAWVGAPITLRDGRPLGALHLLDHEGPAFNDYDEAVLVQLAQLTAAAVEHARVADELRARDQAKNEFLAVLAHELRNPMAALANGLKLLEGDALTRESARATHEMMDRQLSQLVRMVDDLLDLSRVTRGRIVLKTALVDLTDVIERAVEAVRPAYEAAGHGLRVELPSSPLRVLADPARLVQVLVNLLDNAAKYTPSPGTIVIDASEDGAELVVRVTDNGVGIDRERLPRVFDALALAHSINEAAFGLGIGLALVRQLVELHGGSVSVHSEGPGLGSQFAVRLPMVREVTQAPSRRDAAPGGKEASVRVLVVDDNADAADSLALLLGQMGHDTRVVYDGESALQELQTGWADVALLDIGMPDMSGYEVARRLKENGAPAVQPVLVALTGWGQDEDRARSLGAGFTHHLTKPVMLDVLTDVLATVHVAR